MNLLELQQSLSGFVLSKSWVQQWDEELDHVKSTLAFLGSQWNAQSVSLSPDMNAHSHRAIALKRIAWRLKTSRLDADAVLLEGRAHLTAEASLLLDPDDPFRWGIRA